MATIMDGKSRSLKHKEQMKQRIAQLKQQGINPKLVVVLVGDNSASQVYVRNKHKSCGEVGIESEVITMPEQTTQQELLEVVERLNQDETVDGILVQLPLPKQIDEKTVLRAESLQCSRNTASTSQERTVLSSAEATSWANRWQRCC